MTRYDKYMAFLAKKEDMISALSDAIYETMIKMDEDIKGVPWFSSRSDDYVAKSYDIAC